jgi:hypothetical protein
MSINEDFIYIPYNKVLEEGVTNMEGVTVSVMKENKHTYNVCMDIHHKSRIFPWIKNLIDTLPTGCDIGPKIGVGSRIFISGKHMDSNIRMGMKIPYTVNLHWVKGKVFQYAREQELIALTDLSKALEDNTLATVSGMQLRMLVSLAPRMIEALINQIKEEEKT